MPLTTTPCIIPQLSTQTHLITADDLTDKSTDKPQKEKVADPEQNFHSFDHPDFTSSQIPQLMLSLEKSHPALGSLSLSQLNLDNYAVSMISASLSYFPTLRILVLNSNNLTDDHVAVLAKMFETNKTLLQLDLSSNQFGPKGVKALCDALEKNTSVSSLTLDKNPLTSEGVATLANFVRTNTSLERLSMNGIDISEGGFSMGPMLMFNKTLQTLLLSGCNVNKILSSFVGALIGNEKLELINLSNNALGSEGVLKLSSAFNLIPHVKILMLNENNVTPNGIFGAYYAAYHAAKQGQPISLQFKEGDNNFTDVQTAFERLNAKKNAFENTPASCNEVFEAARLAKKSANDACINLEDQYFQAHLGNLLNEVTTVSSSNMFDAQEANS